MNLSPYKSWSTGETLTSADLNSSFLQITNHTITNSDVDSTGNYVLGTLVVGTGLASADGKLHVHSASAGSVTAQADADELVLENSGASGLTVLSGTSSAGSIFFGDSGDNDIGKISYSHSSNALTFTTNTTTALTLSSAQAASFSGLITGNVGAEVKNGSTSAGFVKFYEDSDNGSNAVTLIGPASTADVTLTLPASTDTLVGKATTDTLTNKTLTSPVLNTGVSGTAVLDEDDMSSNSATQLATQQSIKAYVDSTGNMGGTLGSTDNAVPRANGTGGVTLQASSVLIDDSNNITGVVNLTASGELDGATLDISGNADIDGQTNLDTVDIDGAVQIDGTVTVGVDDTGYDLRIYGATSGSSVLFDESADDMILTNYGLAVGSDATGDIYYRNAAGFLARLGAGTAGHFLKQGSSIPEWAAVSGSGVGDFSGPGSSTDNSVVRFSGTTGKLGQGSSVLIDDSDNVSGANSITMADGKEIIFGSNDDIKIEYDEAGYDSLLIQAGVNDAGVGIVLSADGSADNGDDWKVNAANGGVLTFGNDISGSMVTGITVTPHATATSWELAFVGEISADSLDIGGNVDVDGTLEADAITLAGTALGSLYSPIAGSSSIVTTGTIGTGTWQGTAIASAYLDSDTAHLSGTQTFTGNKTFTGTVTTGVDDTGVDVKFFGASAGAYMEWDESADQLRLMGASADATTSTGKLLLATSLTDINANDVLGKIDFQAPHEAGGTDAVEISASIQAVAQSTFSASSNATDLIFYTGHSEAATEKFRITSQGELGVGGANYGSDGQVLTSTGAGTAPAWENASGAYTDWALKDTNYTATSHDQLICKHASTAFTITLPSSPTAMDTVVIKNCGAATVTVGRNSSNIDSAAADGTLLQGGAVQLVYVDGTIGWASL